VILACVVVTQCQRVTDGHTGHSYYRHLSGRQHVLKRKTPDACIRYIVYTHRQYSSKTRDIDVETLTVTLSQLWD